MRGGVSRSMRPNGTKHERFASAAATRRAALAPAPRPLAFWVGFDAKSACPMRLVYRPTARSSLAARVSQFDAHFGPSEPPSALAAYQTVPQWRSAGKSAGPLGKP